MTPFSFGAFVLKEWFQTLWIGYRDLIEPMLLDDQLAIPFCKVEVPSKLLTSRSLVEGRIGTCSRYLPWKNENQKDTLTCHWDSTVKREKNKCAEKDSQVLAQATVKVFCMENVCKTGLNGIVRFLLMKKAPSYIFKTELVKWVIIWKWESTWRQRCWKDICFYSVLLVLYSAHAIIVAHDGITMDSIGWDEVVASLLLIVLMVMTSFMIRQEYMQLKTYTEDGKRQFQDDNPRWGIMYYLSSSWNRLELHSYFLMMVVIPTLHCFSFYRKYIQCLLYSFVAVQAIFLWIKVFYFAQTFRVTGALVLLIENVIKDSLPFLFLSFVVLIGFSLGLYVLFRYSLSDTSNYWSSEDKEDYIKTRNSFNKPWDAMVTLFFAMVGTIELDILTRQTRMLFLIKVIFIAYVGIQMIVMLNMLIAIMSDTFDKVKSREEEQLLMGRARFIDACEASLSSDQINAIEDETGKYLYILTDDSGSSKTGVVEWEGKIKTIEENVQRMIRTSEENTNRELQKAISILTEMLDKTNETLAALTELKNPPKREDNVGEGD